MTSARGFSGAATETDRQEALYHFRRGLEDAEPCGIYRQAGIDRYVASFETRLRSIADLNARRRSGS
jgi:hypothetical protein